MCSYLSLKGEIFTNHSYVDISDIGFSDYTALVCITDRPPPSGSTGRDWYAPDGTTVGSLGTTAVPGFERNRGPMVVRLRRTTSTARYHCEVKDNTEIEQTVLCVLCGNIQWRRYVIGSQNVPGVVDSTLQETSQYLRN